MKINRAIYYQLKTFTDGQIIKDKLKLSKIKKDLKQVKPEMKKQKQEVGQGSNDFGQYGQGSNDFGQYGQGLSDDYDVDMLKNVNYNQLKEIMEK